MPDSVIILRRQNHFLQDYTKPMRRPWNLPSLPVYSLASLDNGCTNMNICTYVSAISMKPKRYIIGIYKGTKTLDNVMACPKMVLQLLAFDQHRLVPLLGQKSGHSIDKLSRIKSGLVHEGEFLLLENAIARIHLQLLSLFDAGDHYAALCDVITYRNLRPNTGILTTTLLREKGLIRA